jgi:nitrogenase molybdenum-cofactor synthesis protein NifE
MGLHRFKPMPSGRMGIFWALSGIREAAVVEYGCMGHTLYGGSALRRAGIYEGFGAALYTTYIDETDISLGETSRLSATISQVIKADRPKVIFLQPSAVPEVIGTDLFALSKTMQPDFPETRLIPIGHGSFAISQHRGVQEALLALAETLPKDTGLSEEPTYNIIGSCPDLFRFQADACEITRLMKGSFNMRTGCILSSDTSVTGIERMGAAHINLVIRREGLPAARALQERFGTPYAFGRPYGIKGTSNWLREVGRAFSREPDKLFMEAEQALALAQIDQAYDYMEDSEWSYPDEAVLSIGGHIDVVKGVFSFATTELPLHKGVCWCDCPEMAEEGIPYFSEDEWVSAVTNHKKGYLMCSGEALKWAGKNTQLQISNPDIAWRIHSYEPPFIGYHGAVHLVNLWINEYMLTH